MSLLRPSTTGPSVQEFMDKLAGLTEGSYQNTKSTIRGMELYSMVYSLVTRVPAPLTVELFGVISEFFENLAKSYKTGLENLQPRTPVEWLKGHAIVWLQYKRTMTKVSCVCLYLDRLTKTKALEKCTIKVFNQSVPLMRISELACLIWSRTFFENGILEESFVRYYEDIRTTHAQRNEEGLAELVDAYVCAEPALIRVSGQCRFVAKIEEAFIASTREFYKDEVLNSLVAMSFADYLLFADNVLKFELETASKVFPHPEQNAPSLLKKLLCEILIINNIEKFYPEFPTVIHTGEQVETFIKLLALAESTREGCDFLSSAAKIFEKEMIVGIEKIVNEHKKKSDESDTQRFADLFGTSMDYLEKMSDFLGDTFFAQEFAQAIERSKVKFLSSRLGKTTMLQAFVKYIDATLSGSLSLEADTAKMVAYFVPHFADIEDLGSLYASALAIRLLHSSEVDYDQELKCIAAFPPEILIRLKRMIGDIQNSRSKGDSSYSCDVLTNLTWPVPSDLAPYSNHDLPKEMQTFATKFETSYIQKHPKQKLTWIHQLSRVTLNYAAPNLRIYELSCTFPQSMLLLKLESAQEVVFGSLVASLKINRRDVYRHLKPLYSIGLIGYSQKVKSYSDVTENVKVRLNLTFEHPKSKIRFGPMSIDGVADDASGRASPVPEPMEISDSTSLTEQDKYALQCSIIMIAKANRTISAAHLHQLVMQGWKRPVQLSHPQISDCLKVLQDKDFLEFDEAHSVFRYIP